MKCSRAATGENHAWHRGALALADVLLLPTLAWVGFASALNLSLWQRNPALLG